jgi:transcription initiation factor TFIIIB Brf1 subunit/transcription initiation factor TFIIB
MIAGNLAGEPDAGEASLLEAIVFRNRHPLGLAADELYAACRAARVPATGVQHVHAVLFERADEARARRHVITSESFNRDSWHRARLYAKCAEPYARRG